MLAHSHRYKLNKQHKTQNTPNVVTKSIEEVYLYVVHFLYLKFYSSNIIM